MTEVWKPIRSLPGYEASSEGRVRSLDRVVQVPKRKGGTYPKRVAGRLLAPQEHIGGYRQVGTPLGSRLVHRLVAEAFFGPCPAGQEVAHLNGDRTDNRVANLAYAEHRENLSHMRIHGTLRLGERNRAAKLSADDVRAIRARRTAGEQCAEIADDYPVSDRTIGKIVRNERWSHV